MLRLGVLGVSALSRYRLGLSALLGVEPGRTLIRCRPRSKPLASRAGVEARAVLWGVGGRLGLASAVLGGPVGLLLARMGLVIGVPCGVAVLLRRPGGALCADVGPAFVPVRLLHRLALLVQGGCVEPGRPGQIASRHIGPTLHHVIGFELTARTVDGYQLPVAVSVGVVRVLHQVRLRSSGLEIVVAQPVRPCAQPRVPRRPRRAISRAARHRSRRRSPAARPHTRCWRRRPDPDRRSCRRTALRAQSALAAPTARRRWPAPRRTAWLWWSTAARRAAGRWRRSGSLQCGCTPRSAGLRPRRPAPPWTDDQAV